MRILFALFFTFFINNLAHAGDYELTVYFNLGVAERHGIVSCRQGGEQLDTEYHLTVFKDEPRYTVLGNLDFDHNVAGDVEQRFHCDHGDFTLKELIHTEDDAVNLFIYLEEIYFIKDDIYKIANVQLPSDEDYFKQEKYIDEFDEAFVKTSHTEQEAISKTVATMTDEGDLLYRIEIRRQ
jgi:hypothetical protein